jgi:hypothetical protein
MRNIFRWPFFVALILSIVLALPLLAQTQSLAGPAMGVVVKSNGGSIGRLGTSEGSSVYSGDYLSTDDNGLLMVRVGKISLELESSSAMHIYTAPYGAVVELNRGSLVYNTPGGNVNVVIVAADVRVTPDVSGPDLGRVSIENPCEITVYSQRGQANAKVGDETHVVEESKAYRVRAENKISYREYLSPDASDYHRYHDHEPCAAADMVHGHLPIAPGQSRFLLISASLIGLGTGLGVWKAMESPSRP